MAESKRAFHFKEIANSLVQTGSRRSCGAFSREAAIKAVAAGPHAMGIAAKALAAPSKIAATQSSLIA